MKRKYEKRNENKKRIFAAVIVVVLVVAMTLGLIAPFFVHAAYAKPVTVYEKQPQEETKTQEPVMPKEIKGSIQIDGTIGFDGIYKAGLKSVAKINLINDGEDFKGKVKVKSAFTNYNQTNAFVLYAKEITLPKGSNTNVSVNFEIGVARKFIEVYVEDEKGNIVSSKNINTKGNPSEAIFIGIVSDNSENLKYFNSMTFDNLQFFQSEKVDTTNVQKQIINLNEKNFPSDLNILRSLNALVINDFDTSRFSNEQMKALTSWIEAGGLLVLGTGSKFDKVMKAIPKDIVDASSDGEETLQKFNINKLSNLDFKSPLVVAKIKANGFEAHTLDKDIVMFHDKNLGKGYVLIHTFDLSSQGFLELRGKENYLQTLYFPYLQSRLYDLINAPNQGNMSYLTSNLPVLENKLTALIFIIVVIYSILIGPVLYFYLKRKDKREKAILLIPISAFAVLAIITVINQPSKYKQQITNTISYVTFDKDTNKGKIESSSRFFSPDKGTVKLHFDKNIDYSFSGDNIYSFGNILEGSVLLEVLQEEDKTDIQYFDMPSWGNGDFYYSQDFDYTGNFDANIKFEKYALKGTITNNTGFNFDDIIVGFGNYYGRYLNFKNGDTIDINIKIDSTHTYYDAYSVLSEFYSTNEYDDSKSQSDKDAQIEKIKLMTREDKRMSRLKLDLLANYINNVESYNNNNSSVQNTDSLLEELLEITGEKDLFVAFNSPENSQFKLNIYGINGKDISNLGVAINNKKPNKYFTNVFKYETPVDLSKNSNFDLSAGIVTPKNIYTTTPLQYFNLGEISLSSGNAYAVFQLPKSSKISFFSIDWEANDSENGNSYIFNAAENKWEYLLSEGYSNENEIKKYINENGEILVKIENLKGIANYPTITIKGGK